MGPYPDPRMPRRNQAEPGLWGRFPRLVIAVEPANKVRMCGMRNAGSAGTDGVRVK